jgi:DNA-binding NarL/FixJ family response regulator
MGARSWATRAARELEAAGAPDTHDSTDPRDWSAELTTRERDVCELVAAGQTNREVGVALFLSPRTVEHHLRSSYRKLGVRSRTELAARHRG